MRVSPVENTAKSPLASMLRNDPGRPVNVRDEECRKGEDGALLGKPTRTENRGSGRGTQLSPRVRRVQTIHQTPNRIT